MSMSNFQKEINYQLSSPYPLSSRKVKTLFAKQGKPIKQLVAESGITFSYISKHIHGRVRNPVVQQAIADFLGVSLEAILDKSQKPKGLKSKRKPAVRRPSSSSPSEGGSASLTASSQN